MASHSFPDKQRDCKADIQEYEKNQGGKQERLNISRIDASIVAEVMVR